MKESFNRGKGFTRNRSAACPTCHREFTSDSNFDRHRRSVSVGENKRVCVDPSTVGLVLNKRGIWQSASVSERPNHWSQK